MAWADGQDEISNSEDIIDSREVVARIEFLTNERADLLEALNNAVDELNTNNSDDALRSVVSENREALEDWDNSNKDELDALIAFTKELADYCPDWEHGTTLIRDSHWDDYVQELLEDIGDLPKDLPNYIVIDWERTGANIQMDYTSGEFDGVTYWAR